MLNKNLLYVLTVLESIEKIFIYTKEFNNSEEFFNNDDQKNFNAVINLLMAIGEDSKKLDESFKKRFPKINWYAIISLRNELAHNYRGIDADIIWDIVQNYLDDLKHAFIDIFTQINKKGIKRELKKILNNEYYSHIKYLINKI